MQLLQTPTKDIRLCILSHWSDLMSALKLQAQTRIWVHHTSWVHNCTVSCLIVTEAQP